MRHHEEPQLYRQPMDTVIAASYNSGNGNYVKIKHNQTYSTQYLHMSGFAKGIRKGVFVEQGQTIGYVGSTGLATGPQMCYRFHGRMANRLIIEPKKFHLQFLWIIPCCLPT